MLKRFSTAWLLIASMAFASAATAQTAGPPANAAAPTGTQEDAGSGAAQQGVWRASDLIGQDVFSPNGEDVGEISDIVLGRDGRIAGFVLEAGGLLGAGERKVAVLLQTVRIDPVDTTVSTGTVQDGLPASTRPGARARADMQITNVLSPGRIILNLSPDQLKAAPQFQEP